MRALFPAFILSLTPAVAFGQTYVDVVSETPLVRLADLPGVSGITALSFTNADDGYTQAVPIGFSFPFAGGSYSSVYVSTNGFVSFEALTESHKGNRPFGENRAPNAIIAPVWDDLVLPSTSAGSVGTVGTAPNRIFVIEVAGFRSFSGTADTGVWQVWLHEGAGGRFEARIGNTGPLAGAYSASSGYEGPNGTHAHAFLSCGNTCGAAQLNTLVGRSYAAGLAVGAELAGSFVSSPTGALPGGSADATVRLSNIGTATAAAFDARLYLSTDRVFDGADVLVGTTNAPALAPGASIDRTLSLTVPGNTPAGAYNLLLLVDAADVVPEAFESNNLVVSNTAFATGPDLRVDVVQALGDGAPGQPVRFRVRVGQGALKYDGPGTIEIFASVDRVLDAADASFGVATASIASGGSGDVEIELTTPSIPPRSYFAIAVVDAAARIPELDEANNAGTSAQTFRVGPDFTIATLTNPSQVEPGTSAAISLEVGSVGAPFRGEVAYRIYASIDDRFDAAVDTALFDGTVTFAGEARVAASPQVPFPMSLPGGRYRIIAVADPAGAIPELDDNNNFRISSVSITNGYDFGVASVTAPANTEASATIAVSAAIVSNGVPFGGDVGYSVFLSFDNTFTPDDVQIFTSSARMARLNRVPINVQAVVPPTTPIRNHFVIVVANPAALVPETDPNNNWGSSPTSMTLRGADLRAESFEGDPVAFYNRPYRAKIVIENQGEATARDFRYSVRISDNDIIRVNDPEVFRSELLTLAPETTATYFADVTMPTFTSSTTRYLGVMVDIDSNVPETQEGNNIRALSHPVVVTSPIPDLAIEIVKTQTVAAAGEFLAVTRLLKNRGVAAASNFDYVYYLSSNQQITSDDPVIATLRATLAEGTDDYGIDVIRLPGTIAAGVYYVGAEVDPAKRVTESDDANNLALGGTVRIYGSPIAIQTDRLPNATLDVPYEVALYAAGGPVPPTWSIASGALPPGLALDAAGFISGRPEREGLFEFAVRASSGSSSTEKPLSIRVVTPTVQLRVASTVLPSALVGAPYAGELVAVGGVEPYQWTAATQLPAGLDLAEDGALSGTVQAPGNFRFSVRVVDALGEVATAEVALNAIRSVGSVAIVQRPLPRATIGVEYCQPDPIELVAEGGLRPYRWSLLDAGVPGLALAEDGRLCGTPTRVGLYDVRVRAQDQTGLYDTSIFLLEVDDGSDLGISTITLPKGKVNEPYSTQVAAIQGREPYTWSIADLALPPGLSLGADATIAGTPTSAGTYSFTVMVVDADLRSDLRPLSIVIEGLPDGGGGGGDDGCGCAATPRTSGGLWPAVLLVGLGLGLRRRRLAGLLLGLLAVGAPVLAEAQDRVTGTPYIRFRRPHTFTPLSGPTVIFSPPADDETEVINLPFPFKFYDTTFTSVVIGVNGGLVFGSSGSVSGSNPTPGSTSSPNAFIAGFWDDLDMNTGQGGQVGYRVEGPNGSRTITFEWKNIDRWSDPGAKLNWQFVLHEGPGGRILVNYGSVGGTGSSVNGTMGMEDDRGGRAIYFDTAASPCTTSCDFAALRRVANTQIELVQDPGVELFAVAARPPRFGFIGAAFDVPVEMASLHGSPIGPFRYALEVRSLGASPRVESFFVSEPLTLSAFESRALVARATLPAGLAEGEYTVRLVVDPNNEIAEAIEDNNGIDSADTVRVLRGRPDLKVTEVTASKSRVTPGEQLEIAFRVRNVGAEAVTDVPVAAVLSTNPAISANDSQLGQALVTLGPGAARRERLTVTIDPATNSGTYHLGAVADPEQVVDELDEANNGLAAEPALTVEGVALAILTNRLPAGVRGVTYSAFLAAVGGDRTYRWELVSGTLPAGLGLVPGSGELFGRPTASGTANVTVQVSSAGQSVRRELTVTVLEPGSPLTVVTRRLPSAVVGQEYAVELVAIGGAMTSTVYTWSGTGLPSGLSLSPRGALAGTPAEARTATMTVQVTDGVGMSARELVLKIRDHAQLLIDPSPLPPARYGQAYDESLTASGGRPPYVWTISTGELPGGLTFDSSTGRLSGTPTEVGRFRLVVEARDSAPEGFQATDLQTIELTIEDDGGFSIATTSIPLGYVGVTYDAAIEATGGELPYTWRIVRGRLPKAVASEVSVQTGEFRLAGIPESEGETNLLIEVTDARGRTADRPYVLSVGPTPPPTVEPPVDEGCSCTAGERPAGGLALFGLLALALVARRRR